MKQKHLRFLFFTLIIWFLVTVCNFSLSQNERSPTEDVSTEESAENTDGISIIDLLNPPPEDISTEEFALEFTLTTFDGVEIGPEDMEGKIILVNFWSSWCIPCVDNVQILQSAWEFYQNRDDILFIGIVYEDTSTGSLEVLDRFSVTYPNGPDLENAISQSFGIRGVPETFILDQQGKLSHDRIGQFYSVNEITYIIGELINSVE